jgi:protein-S-isoprenylcysteine O-methyltransferase Ste14
MAASAIEFRLRVWIMVTIVLLGFWSPWIETWGLGQRNSLLEWLALELSRLGLLTFTAATPVVIVFATVVAATAMVLRLWGTAYLGSAVVHNAQMKAGAVMADGPYRYVRNPLYLGSWFMIAAICFLMPATGALFTMSLITLFLLRLILGEEVFLKSQLGEPYGAYLRTVPRLAPRLRTELPSAGSAAHWGRALISELNAIGVFLTLALLSWRYDNRLMMRAVLVTFGISLVVRALMPRIRTEPA